MEYKNYERAGKMNYIWCFMVVISIIVSIFNGTAEETINAGFEGASAAVSTVLSFAGIMCFWTGILKIAEKSGFSEKIQRLLRPVTRFLFPNVSDEARGFIAMNMSANLLGMGNAATPMGIKAMKCLDRENLTPEKASDDMCMLVIINTASLQLIPTTVIALRSAAGSAEPLSIMLPVWISSLTALLTAVLLAKLILRKL